jgi:hypothetical protein
MRRKKAGEIRARPGASRKGVPKKVTDGEKARIESYDLQPNGDNATEAMDSGEANCSGGGWREQLADMRWVYGHPISQDETQGHKICRQWLRDKKAEFMSYKSRLEEKAMLAGPEKEENKESKESKAQDEDLKTLLNEWGVSLKAKQASENADLAAEPDAMETGKLHQEELRAALWRERLLWNKVEKLENRERKEYGVIETFFDECQLKARSEYTELAIRPNPEKVIGSLRIALKGTQEHEEHLRKRVEQLEPNGTATTGDSGTSRKRTSSGRREEPAVKSTPSVNGQKELAGSAISGTDFEEI